MATGTNVFISYTSDTRPLAEKLARELKEQGFEPWVDFMNLQPGQRWNEIIGRAVEQAQWVAILVGRDSRVTPWQEAEWSAALAGTWADKEKRLLPIIFGNADPPPFLRNWVGLRIDPDSEVATWTRRVIDVLRNSSDEAFGADPKSREERQRRLEEMGQDIAVLRDPTR